MQRRNLLAWSLLAALFLAANAAAQDVVWLKNGDRYTGKILSASATELTFETVHGDKVKIPLGEMQGFSSDRPLRITLDGDQVVEGQARRVDAGGLIVTTAAGETAIPDLSRIQGLSDPAVKPKVWSGKAYGAATLSSGNTRERSVHADAEIVGRWTKTRLNLQGAWDYAESEDVLITRKAYGQAKYDWFALDRLYAYGRGRIEGDTFQDLAYRLLLGGGAGYEILKQDNLGFDLELGASWVREDLVNGGEDDDYASADGAARFLWKITEDIAFREELLAYKNLEDTDDIRMISTTNLDIALNSALSLTAKMVLEYDNTPAPGAKRRDARYMLGITYNFW
jgi:putative salt-induced outer membrane protein YdiY